MHGSSVPLLLLAAGAVGFLHSILPDHWVPLAVVSRTHRWTIARTARTSLLASVGHVLTSIVLAGIIALVGLQFRQAFETQQGHIVGVILVATGIGFFIWSFKGGGHHHHHEHEHDGDHHHHERIFVPGIGTVDAAGHPAEANRSPMKGGIAGIVVPFGAAASPDLTVLPVALAAAGVGLAAVGGVLLTFSAVTLGTFVVLTVGATIAGYQVKGDWLEDHGTMITAVVLAGIGAAVFAGL
jgi:nickel/cobalt transporter (NicO) family protein